MGVQLARPKTRDGGKSELKGGEVRVPKCHHHAVAVCQVEHVLGVFPDLGSICHRWKA